MTRQELFDTVAEHLLKQNAKSERYDTWSKGPLCAFRDEVGRTCAVGCLIPYGLIREADQCETIHSPQIYAVLKELGLSEHLDLLGALQRVHDMREPSAWRSSLRAVADKQGLSATVLEEVTRV